MAPAGGICLPGKRPGAAMALFHVVQADWGSSPGRLGVPRGWWACTQPPCAALLSQKAHSRPALSGLRDVVMLIHWVRSAVLAGSPIIVPFYW